MLFFSSIGYLVGVLIRISKVFIVVIPTLFIGILICDTKYDFTLFDELISFIFHENSLLLFVIKTAFISCFLFAFGIALTSRLEVKQ